MEIKKGVLLIDQIKSIIEDAELVPVDSPIGEREVVVGECTAYEQKLFSAMEKLHKEKRVRVAMLGKKDCIVGESFTTDQVKVQELNKLVELFAELFWMEVRHNHDLSDRPNIGIRDGYKLVALPHEEVEDEDDSLKGLLKKLVGGKSSGIVVVKV